MKDAAQQAQADRVRYLGQIVTYNDRVETYARSLR